MQIASIGIFENPTDDIAPSHVCPILVRGQPGNWHRTSYYFLRPYRIRLDNPFGGAADNPGKLFPRQSYLIHPPVPVSYETQVIFLGKGRLVYETRRPRIILYLALNVIRFRTLRYLRNTIATIANMYRET